MRRIFAAHAIVILFCALTAPSHADTNSVKRWIIDNYYKELPKEVTMLPWKQFKEYVDPYTDIFSPQELDDYLKHSQGISSGRIGILRQEHPMGWEITAVVPSSPAYWAGLCVGDVLVSANDTALTWADDRKLTNMVRGATGTWVMIEYLRGGMCRRIAIQRGDILEDPIFCMVVGKTLSIRITQFGEGLHDRFSELTSKIDEDKIDTVVFDLRDNPGGRVDETLRMLSEFIEHEDTLMAMVSRHDTDYKVASFFGGWRGERTYIILQNEGSASASEIFAGAMVVRCSATVIGKTSYGKGRVQGVYQREKDDDFGDTAIGGFKFTRSIYLAGGTLAVDSVGIKPHVIVEFPKPSIASLPVDFDVVRWRMEAPFPTQADVDRVNALGHGPIATLVWGQRVAPFESYRTLQAVGHLIPRSLWACTVDHDTVPTSYTRKEEQAIRRLIARTYEGELSDSVLQLEPLERLLEHAKQIVTAVRNTPGAERPEPTGPHADDLGIGLDTIHGTVYVTSVFPRSSAFTAGLCIGDRIIRVNQKLCATGIDWARRDIRRAATAAKTVQLLVQRGEQTLRLTLPVRGRDLTAIHSYINDGIGFMTLERGPSSTYESNQIIGRIVTLRDSGVHSIVIDLRGAVGGAMESTIRVMELFAKKGDTLARIWKGGRLHRAILAKTNGKYRRMAVYLCVDERTQGAVEFLASIMQRNRYATVVGRPTFGAMREEEVHSMPGNVSVTTVLHQFGLRLDERVEPDVPARLPQPSPLLVGRAAAMIGDPMVWRNTWHEPTEDLVREAMLASKLSGKQFDRDVMVAAIYGNAGRLFTIAPFMRQLILTSPPVTKR